nr:putative ribonuclease H-like domain-containing protein [Tanacetum cinerariifolium]
MIGSLMYLTTSRPDIMFAVCACARHQTTVATSTTEAEYVAAASCCGQVLWIQNQLLNYGNNFMNTKIYIDNNSAICIVKNPVYHSKTKHKEIRHHFIRDCFEKKLISMDHIHTDENVVDLLTKPFDAGRFQYLVGDPQDALKDTWIFDIGCSMNMTGNKSDLIDYQEYDGGFVAFAGNSKGGKIRTGKLDFEDVYFVKELKFNLFSVSHMCDKKNSVVFTKTKCLILSLDFKLPNESQVLRKVPRYNNMYSFDLKNVVPSKGLTCLFAKGTNDESNL